MASKTPFPPKDIIARAWRLGVENVAPMGGGHGSQALVKTQGGRALVLKEFRRIELAHDQAEAVLGAVARAAARDGIDTAAPLPQRGDRDFLLEWDDRRFYLTNFIDGVRPSFKRVEDVAAALRALGRLHRTAGGLGRELAGAMGWPASLNLGVICADAVDAYRIVMAVLGRRENGAGLRRLARGMDRVEAQVAAACDLAPQSVERGSTVPVALCHGDTHENNFLVLEALVADAGGEGEPLHRAALIDVESFEPRAAVEDLIVPLQYLGFFTRWKAAGMRRALAAYERERPLAAVERVFLAAQLTLPRHWLRATQSLLKKGGSLRDIRTWLKRRRSLRNLERQRRCVVEVLV